MSEFFPFNTSEATTLQRLIDTAVPVATLTDAGSVLKAATVAAAPVPFVSLTEAANAYNALRTSLRNAGILA